MASLIVIYCRSFGSEKLDEKLASLHSGEHACQSTNAAKDPFVVSVTILPAQPVHFPFRI
jgi:hypothetical protein